MLGNGYKDTDLAPLLDEAGSTKDKMCMDNTHGSQGFSDLRKHSCSNRMNCFGSLFQNYELLVLIKLFLAVEQAKRFKSS